MWNHKLPPGFQGLREDQPLETYVRHLPHWRQEGATYFVTFRLGDSLPQNKLDELVALRLDWERRHKQPDSRDTLEQLAREATQRTERWLDQGMGSCLLRDQSNATILTDSMHYFDNDRYELGAYVVMPNHAHAIVRPLKHLEYPLEEILGSWKQFSSRRINARIGQNGNLWQEESYDRIIRDEVHLYRCLQYIGRNPSNAGLSGTCPLWVRPEWQALGWVFEGTS